MADLSTLSERARDLLERSEQIWKVPRMDDKSESTVREDFLRNELKADPDREAILQELLPFRSGWSRYSGS